MLWTGYLFLEGFDLGVGMLMKGFARNNTERRVLLNTIGPVWDGNEVWLLTAGGATFAAFPLWYASLFSALYLPLLLVLVALIFRAVAFEYRGKVDNPRWRARWDWAISLGSLVAAFGVGAALALTTTGLPLNANGDREGGPFAWFSAYAVLGGLAVVGFSLLHGLAFLALKTDGDVRHRARRWFVRLLPVLLLPMAGWAVSLQLLSGEAVDRGGRRRRRRGRRRGLELRPHGCRRPRVPVPGRLPAPRQRLDLRRRVPRGAAVHPEPGLPPDHLQRLLLGLHAGADEHRRLHRAAAGPRVPGLDLLGVPAPGERTLTSPRPTASSPPSPPRRWHPRTSTR